MYKDNEMIGSLTRYAIHRGVSPPTVTKAIRTGRLSKSVKRLGRTYEIDFVLADEEWLANTDTRRLPPEEDADTDDAGIPDYHHSRKRNEHFKAEQARLELQRRRGELLDATEAGRQVFGAFRVTRDQLLAMAPRLTDVVHDARGRSDAIAAVKRELHAILTELSDGIEQRFGAQSD
jgi:hypothetical protein